MIIDFENEWKKRTQKIVNSYLNHGLLCKFGDEWYIIWTRKETFLGKTIGQARDTLMEIINQKYQEDRLKIELKQLNDEISSLKIRKQEVESKIAALRCPFAIGDKVVDKNGTLAIVDSIRYSPWGGYRFKVKKIKKDGGLYKYSYDAWVGDEWVKHE